MNPKIETKMDDLVSILNDFISVLKKEYKDIDYILIENTCFGRALPNIRIRIIPVDYRMEYLSFREWVVKNDNVYVMSINADHVKDAIKNAIRLIGVEVKIKVNIHGYNHCMRDNRLQFETKTA